MRLQYVKLVQHLRPMNKLFLPLRVLTVSVSLLTFSCTKEQVQVVNEKTVATKAALGEDSLEESANSKYVIDEGMVRQYYSRTAPGKRILSIEPYLPSIYTGRYANYLSGLY